MPVQPSTDITALEPGTQRELDNLVPTVSRMAQYGNWSEVPYSADNFFALTGVWTVARVHHRSYYFTVFNGLLQMAVYLVGTTTGAGMGSELYLRLPPGYAVLPNIGTVGFGAWNAAAAATPAIVASAQSILIPNCLTLLRDGASTAWPSSSTISIGIVATVPVYQV